MIGILSGACGDGPTTPEFTLKKTTDCVRDYYDQTRCSTVFTTADPGSTCDAFGDCTIVCSEYQSICDELLDGGGSGGSGGGGGSGGTGRGPITANRIGGTDPTGINCTDGGYLLSEISQMQVVNKAAFAAALRSNALPQSVGKCARYVRVALCASSGIACNGGPNAREYGPFLQALGFTVVGQGNGVQLPPDYTPQLGDIAVFTYTPFGHVCAWDGTNWTSDFIQNTIQPSKANPREYTIYRKP